ncbi:hypothetical protein [Sphingomonas segetis]|jgi:hypothetical protein|uniref:hypothetical protein n=1 Tax=Sphingomonas segetis TaxID=1104779 RepID=UPI0012D31F39|nr:hypothetical protein [Sphingomonas segetis]
MKSYQVYSIDSQGVISGERRIDAADDAAAVFTVKAMQRPLETQIWDGDRRVARIAAHQG